MVPEKAETGIKQNIRVKELDSNDIPRWSQYVAECSKATFYHRIEWKQIIEKSFKHKTYYLIAEQSLSDQTNPTNPIVGILPMVHIRSVLFGSIFCSMPFLNFGGVCADHDEAEKALIFAAEKILKERRGDYLELRQLTRSSIDVPLKSHKVSMTLKLDPDPEALWKGFSTKHRTNIRRIAKNGFETKCGGKELLRDFYSVMCGGWKKLGTPIYGYSFFENIMDTLGDSVEIYLVTFQSKPISAAFNGLFKDMVEGMWLATLPEFEKLSPSYLLYWEMIKRMCERGYRQFHLGRSSVEGGGEAFKKKWNAEPTQLYWEYILNRCEKIPELNVQNPKYQLAIRTWRRLPLLMTKTVGPILAKSIP